MTGNTVVATPAAATTALANVSLTTDTLTVPAAAVSAFRSTADAFVKIGMTYTPDTGSAVVNPVVVKVEACPAT